MTGSSFLNRTALLRNEAIQRFCHSCGRNSQATRRVSRSTTSTLASIPAAQSGKSSGLPYVTRARICSRSTGSLRWRRRPFARGTEIVRLFARFALGASFLSAVADRFGLWGPYGAKNVSWGNFAHFVEYTGAVTSLFPSSSTVPFAWAATVAETLFGILLIAGFKIRMASVLSG